MKMKDTDVEAKQKNDKIEVVGESLIQHGKLNNRVYLMRISEQDDPAKIFESIHRLVEANGYTKIFAKIPSNLLPVLIEKNFSIEAVIPNFYYGKTDAFFVSAFYDKNRAHPDPDAMKSFKEMLVNFNPNTVFKPDVEIPMKELQIQDAAEIAKIYKKVFKSYPFPIHDPEYIKDTMKTHVRYFGIREDNRLTAVSSAEIDDKYKNSEMTDFAVDPEFRGRKLACYLLYEMEKQLAKHGIKTAYTIARLHSPAMNITFLKNGYKYSGTLVKNTNISGKIESMNVYYKPLK